MKRAITAKYFERAKRFVATGDGWVLTVRASTKAHLSDVLFKHRLKLKGRWENVEKGIYTAALSRKP